MPAYMTTVAAPAAYAAAPDVSLAFVPDVLVLRADSGTFLYSFDGVEDHGRVISTDSPLVLPTKRQKIWFKQSGGASTARVSALTTS